MKKILITLIAMTILLVTSCSVNNLKKKFTKMTSDIPTNHSMPIDNHELTITMLPDESIFMCSDRIIVNRNEIKKQLFTAIALNKNVELSSVFVNGISSIIQELSGYNNRYFGNSLTKKQLSNIQNNCNLYEIGLPAYAENDSLATIEIKYIIDLNKKFANSILNDNSFILSSSDAIFPLSYRKDAPATIKVIVPKKYEVTVNSEKGVLIKENNLIKTMKFKVFSSLLDFRIIGTK